jgi:transcriptional regulator with PAS, ATPase and Fis domain
MSKKKKTTETQPTQPLTLFEVERTHVQRVLAQLDGNKRQAAFALGIDRRTLYRRLRDYARMAEG